MDPIASRVPYLLDNAGAEAPARLTALAAMFDPGTIRHLESRGVGPGWHCLEVGGGAGSVAAWLATRVGPTGHVLVTDIDPRFLRHSTFPTSRSVVMTSRRIRSPNRRSTSSMSVWCSIICWSRPACWRGCARRSNRAAGW